MPLPVTSYANADLSIHSANKPRWNTPSFRRQGFHQLHTNNRYGMTLRSDQVLALASSPNPVIADNPEVIALTSSNIFSAMVVVEQQTVLYESYADDFPPDAPHSIQSITKLFVNLMVGELVHHGALDLQQTVGHYLPEMGSGYAGARLQDVMDMNIENHYTEDYNDPYASSYGQESTIGWRLPAADEPLVDQFGFLQGIESDDLCNHSGRVNYKSANTDVMAWIVQRVSGKPVRQWMLEIIEAAGIEQAFYCGTDRGGFPVVNGGGSMSARDLARFGLLFARRGTGVANRQVGNSDFIEQTVSRANLGFGGLREGLFYRNQAFTNGEWIGHSGYGGQFMLASLRTGRVGVFFSVLENDSAYDLAYSERMIRMLQAVTEA